MQGDTHLDYFWLWLDNIKTNIEHIVLKNLWPDPKKPLAKKPLALPSFASTVTVPNTAMDVEKIFSRGGGAVGDFLKLFQGGSKSGEIWFLPLEIEKTTFFANNFKIQGGLAPPSDAHEHSYAKTLISVKIYVLLERSQVVWFQQTYALTLCISVTY